MKSNEEIDREIAEGKIRQLRAALVQCEALLLQSQRDGITFDETAVVLDVVRAGLKETT